MALLEMHGITMEFPGVRALQSVDLELCVGEVLGLVGENGAGKSTLMKILCGVHPAGSFGGEIRLGGIPQRFLSTRDAERAGVAMVHQELNLVLEMTVADNLLLGKEPRRFGLIDTIALVRAAEVLLGRFTGGEPGLGRIDPERPVSELGVGLQQVVEIARALGASARIVILDEPTAALTEKEAERLFEIIAALKAEGTTFIYISHRMEEIFTICDRVAVLRDGRSVGSLCVKDSRPADIVAMVVGQELAQLQMDHAPPKGAPVLEIEHLMVAHPEWSDRRVVDDVSFTVRAGEIVTLAGAMGSGRTATLSAVFGNARARASGSVRVGGRPVTLGSPRSAIEGGVALVPEDRKGQGLVLSMTVGQNLTLASLPGALLDAIAEELAAEGQVRELRIKTASLSNEIVTLSGGNQQKVVIGKWLATHPRVLLLDEPTRGVDVGAKAEIYRLIRGLVDKGVAVLMASSDLPEVVLLSDRVIVLRDGRIAGELGRAEVSQEAIMQLAIGVQQ